MKTKTFLCLCLLLGIATTQLSAQNGQSGSGTIHYGTSVYYDGYVPVLCEGVIIDNLYFPVMKVSSKEHFVHGESTVFMNQVNNNVCYSEKTGEKFKLQGFDHWFGDKGYVTTTGHMIGNKGNNYSWSITYDINTWEIVKINSACY